MITVHFDVKLGELTFSEDNESLIFTLLKTSVGNFTTVLNPHEHTRMIKKLVANMELK